MNVVKKLAVVLSLGVLTMVASASSKEKAYVASYEGTSGQPVPIVVKAPDVTATRGAEVILEFIVDKNGVPQGITIASSNDRELADAAVEAVKEWRFNPLVKNGVAVDSKVKLPIVAVVPGLGSSAFAIR